MQGPIATIGSNHTCPMCSGTTPHVGGPVSKSGAPGVTLNGKPIALMGDICTCAGPPDIIAQGSTGVTVNGIPVATMNCMTAHGGVIAEGEPGITITSNSPNPTATIPVSKIPFPEITIVNKVLGNTKEAQTRQQELREVAEQEEEEPREVTLESTYPLDELTEFSKQFGASFFNYGMQAIFSDANEAEDKKIPLHAYDYLYRDLSDGKVEMPEIIIDHATYRKAEYVNAANTINISQNLVIRATEERDIEAMGELYQALMEEFGHFIDWQLRNHYTAIGGDTPLDEGAVFGYCLTTLNIFEDTFIDFGRATVDGTQYELKIDLTEIQEQMDKLVSQERIKRDSQGPTGEYFSAGMKTFEEAGGYTHYGIEEVLLANDIFKDRMDLNYTYLGNLLRDWSQLITPSTERYTEAQKSEISSSLNLTGKEKKEFFGLQHLNPVKLSREHLSFVIELIAAHELVGADLKTKQIETGKGNSLIATATSPTKAVATTTGGVGGAVKDFVKDKAEKLGIAAIEWSIEYYQFCKWYPRLDPSIIGVYKPEEHIDNPVGAAMVDLHKKEYLYWPPEVDPDINPHYGMKNYLRNETNNTEQKTTTQSGVKHTSQKLPTATTYLVSQLEKSCQEHQCGHHKESLMYFGNALHTIEDYFAHSNFIELALIKNGYSEVVPWIERKDPKAMAFNKKKRKVTAFDERTPGEDYFNKETLIKTYKNIQEMQRDYPESKYSTLADRYSIMFESKGQAFQYFLKGEAWGGQLHLIPGVNLIKDTQRPGDYLDHLPIVTGKFGKLDMIHSLLDKIEGMFEAHKFSWKDLISSEKEGKPIVRIIDLIVLTILTDLKHAQHTEYTKKEQYKGLDYAELIEYYQYVVYFRGVVLGILEVAKKGKGWLAVGAWAAIQAINALENVLMNVVKQVMRLIIAGVASGIREGQNLTTLGTNPTHTQIAKDDMGHPLHQLAGTLARIAVADIGKQFDKAKKGRTSMSQVADLAKEYLSHPADVDWMDMTVLKWATTHIGDVREAQSKGFIDKLHKDHDDHLKELVQQRTKMIRVINKEMKEMEQLFTKAKEMEEDLDVTKNARESLEWIENKFNEWMD